MPYQQHTRIRLNGVYGSVADPKEIFSYGVNMTPWGYDVGGNPDAVAAACVNYHGDNRTHVSGTMILTEVALSNVGGDGKQIGNTIRVPVSQVGNGSGGLFPPQVAVRVSLGTGLRGRSNRGGFYLPCPSLTIDPTTGQMSAGIAGGIADATVAFLGALRLVAGGSNRVVIASGAVGNVPVTQVRVGRALDTIRTRRNAIDEGYIAVDVPA